MLGIDRSAEQWGMELIHAPQARAINRGSATVLVGVLDAGIDATHPNLTAAVPTRSAGCLTGKPDQAPGAWRPTTSPHGTHVAGTIAAVDDGHGITGVAPGIRLASVKVVDDHGFIYPEYAVCGFMWAAQQQILIANSSYFLDPWLLTCSDVPGQAVAYEAVRRAVQSQRSTQRPMGCSASPPLLRAGRGRGDRPLAGTARSNRGVSSSGCVLSTIPGGYGYACGTSMAAPHVSGVAALLASARPEAGPEELATLLRQQADPLPCPVHDKPGHDEPDAACVGDTDNGFYGHGLVDALRAVTALPTAPPRSVPGRIALTDGTDRTDR